MGCDRISELPDCLLSQILLDIPTRDSVKTSVLSKRWQFLWLMVPGLDLKASDFPHSRDVFEKFMDKFLEFSHKSRMKKLKIRYDKYNISSYRMVEWIGIWFDRGIQHLDIAFQTLYANMPHNIYKSKTLVSLKLTHVGIKDPKFIVSLPCLKIMHLEDIWYDGNNPFFMERFVSGCPVLEDLTLIDYSNGYFGFIFCLRVRSQTLKTIRFKSEDKRSSRSYFRDYKSDMILVKNLSSLVMIDIDTDFSSKHRDHLSPTKRVIITDFLTGISSVKYMIISQCTLEIIFLYSKPIPKFDNLYRLQAVFSSSMIQFLPIFLESCPNLKDFILSFAVWTEPDQTDLTYVPQCLLSTLECVEIKELLIKEKTWKRLAKYFLENSVVLKKLILRFKDYSIANQDSDIFEELCKFTKHSKECQIIIH